MERIDCPEEGCFYTAPCMKAFKSHYGNMHEPPYPYERKSPYGPHWARQRRRTVERDEYTCVECGCLSQKQGGTVILHVHHIDEDKQNNYLENLQTLCKGCHRQKHDH
ncbi:HNH endonuclease [Haloprofundus sp. MHR1]|uniref:HNH endonuclease n=1 Tax=Haloprofundus sp. MHR1 TaxID=2572921 RepID=UPI0010BF3E24|nr:HNH endonuclease [Haloprofundus sp. MHR1]